MPANPELLTFNQAAEVMAELGGVPVAPNSVHRWTNEGLKSNGERVVLRSRKILGRRYTTRADIQSFLDATK